MRNNDRLENYVEVFRQMPVYLEDEHYVFVHAGVKPGLELKRQREQDLLWILGEFNNYPNTLGKTVI